MVEPVVVSEDVASAMPANETVLLKDNGETIAEKNEDDENGIQEIGGDVKEEEKSENVEMEEQGDVKEGKERKTEEKEEEVESLKIEKENDVIHNEKGEESKGRDIEEEGDEKEKSDGGKMEEEDHEKEEGGSEEMEDEAGFKEDGGDLKMEEGDDLKKENERDRIKEEGEENIEGKGSKKRRRGQKVGEKGISKKKEVGGEKKGELKEKEEGEEKKQEKKKKEAVYEKKTKELSTPVASSIDRPVRERKSVERLVASIEKESVKEFLVEKGRGTPLKDIPNVVYKLSKRKTDDNLKMLHMILFGRRGKVLHIKNNISQFSGFVWHDNEEKQRAKVKEKLEKCVKDKLLDFYDVLDIPVLKTTARKEDLVAKLLDFMVAPHATTDVLLADKDQSNKATKRKSVGGRIGSRRSGGTPAKRSAKKRRKIDNTPKSKEKKSAPETEDEDEDEENENGIPGEDEDGIPEDSEREEKEDETEKEDDNDSGDGKRGLKKSSKRGSTTKVEQGSESEDTGKRRRSSMKSTKRGFTAKVEKGSESEEEDDEYTGKGKWRSTKSTKNGSSGKLDTKKAKTPKLASAATPTKSSTKTSTKSSKVDDTSGSNPRVFSQKKNEDRAPKKSLTPSKPASKAKAGKNVVKEKNKPKKKESSPSREELRNAICDILKEVDFNTATFTDILKQLARRFDTDLTPRKAAIKLMIQEELTKLADEAEENEGDDVEGNPVSSGEEVEA